SFPRARPAIIWRQLSRKPIANAPPARAYDTEQDQVLSMNQYHMRTTLKRRLLKIVLGVLTLVALSVLGLVSWLNMRTEQVRMAEIESHVKRGIESKARVLVDNHALALRGLVADNVFSDVRTLVEKVVEED